MNGCGSVKRLTLNLVAESICKGIGRQVVEARVRMSHIQKPTDLQWCSECGRYYNPITPHECHQKKVNENQRELERFLKRFKIKEEV